MGTPCALSGRPPGLLVQEPEAGVVGQFTRRRGRASALLRDWPIFSERVAIVWQRGARRLQGSRHTAGCADPRPR